MLTHDRGTSVGMIALSMFADRRREPAGRSHPHNANIYLPLANLTGFQKALLDPTVARSTARATTPEMLAAGMGATTFMPRRDAERSRDRRAGEMLRAQRRDRGAAGHDSIPQ